MSLNVGAEFRLRATVDGQQQLDRFNQSLRDTGRAAQVSAGQTAMAMRQLPAQLTDVVTQLAGGQSPFLVLLQQGGQVRDSFGSLGAALRGVASFLTPVTVAIGATAGAVGGLAAAFLAGQRESTEFSRALALTGNYAGATAGQFEAAAARISRVTGATNLATRELLQGAIGSGQFGPQVIEPAVQAMSRLQSISGQTAQEVVKVFSGLGKSAGDWAAETNKAYNFLSLEQYKYIRQLEEQGEKERAAQEAVKALDAALANRTVQLGYLQRAWKAVSDTASGAWNAMLNAGREDTNQKRLQEMQSELERRMARGPLSIPGDKSMDRAWELGNERLRDQIASLQEIIRLEGRAAMQTADRASTNQRAIEEERKAEQERKKQAGERTTEFEQLKRSYQDQLLSVQQLSVADQLLAQIQLGRYKSLTPAQQEQLLNLAREVDLKKLVAEVEETAQRESEKIARQNEADAVREQQRLEAAKQKWLDIIDPVERYRRQLEEIRGLVEQGALTPDQGILAEFNVQEQIEKLNEVKEVGKDTYKDLERAVEGWGRRSTDAFVDFAFTGKASFKDLASSILQDIARMLIQAAITKPLFAAIGSSFGFANGGIMTASGPMPLRTYASGGVANSPQVAIYGEGSKPEAYVPLPDGRTIPVTMRGGMQGGGATTINIGVTVNAETGQSQSGGDNRSGMRELGERIAAGAREVILQERRPGGLLAGA